MPRFVVSMMLVMLAASCASSKGQEAAATERAVPKASPLDAPPAAVTIPDAPGLNVEDLAARLRDAVAWTSGVDVVDELSVRRELAACTEAPCPDAIAEKFRGAAYVVASSVSSLGDIYLATVRVQRGAEEIARTTGQAHDARASLESAGREAGALLRKKLVIEGAVERVALPEAGEAAGNAERGGDG